MNILYKNNYIKTHIRHLLIVLSLFAAGGILFQSSPAQAAACPTPATSLGSATSTINVTTAGTYRIWSRIKSGTAVTDNSYSLEIDGNTCFNFVGNNDSMPTNTWTWVDYINGSTSTKMNTTLTAGTHTIKMIGIENGVGLDRIVMTTDTTCVPTGTGENCANPADTTAPTASISAPTANARIRGTTTVSASASDDSGTVSKVEFYIDGALVGSPDTTSPYSFSWNSTTASNGTHSLTVRAYDAAGNVGTSSAVSVVVDNSPPTVSLTAPANGATVSNTVTINATAADNNAVTSVEFYRGTTLMSSDTASPYSYAWNSTGVSDGSYALTAKAYDAAGNVTTSSAVNVTVDNIVTPPPDTIPPTTSVSAPTNGSTVLNTVNVTASASDNIGVTKVELYLDGSLSGTDVASPYSFSWNTLNYANGSHTLVVKAYDAAGNVGTSTTVTVTVNNPVSTNPGDVNGDGKTTIIDLSILLTNYSTSGTRTKGDLNNDGVINIIDLSILLTNYGT